MSDLERAGTGPRIVEARRAGIPHPGLRVVCARRRGHPGPRARSTPILSHDPARSVISPELVAIRTGAAHCPDHPVNRRPRRNGERAVRGQRVVWHQHEGCGVGDAVCAASQPGIVCSDRPCVAHPGLDDVSAGGRRNPRPAVRTRPILAEGPGRAVVHIELVGVRTGTAGRRCRPRHRRPGRGGPVAIRHERRHAQRVRPRRGVRTERLARVVGRARPGVPDPDLEGVCSDTGWHPHPGVDWAPITADGPLRTVEQEELVPSTVRSPLPQSPSRSRPSPRAPTAHSASPT